MKFGKRFILFVTYIILTHIVNYIPNDWIYLYGLVVGCLMSSATILIEKEEDRE